MGKGGARGVMDRAPFAQQGNRYKNRRFSGGLLPGSGAPDDGSDHDFDGNPSDSTRFWGRLPMRWTDWRRAPPWQLVNCR